MGPGRFVNPCNECSELGFFMTLRQKTIVIMGVALLGLILASYAILPRFFLPPFHKLEREKVLQDLHRFRSEYARNQEDLRRLAWDWANGYGSRHGLNLDAALGSFGDGFQAENLFRRLKLDAMAVFSPSHEMIQGRVRHRHDEGCGPVHPSLRQVLLSGPWSKAEPESRWVSQSGILMLPEGLMVGVVQPVLASGLDDEFQQSVFMGRYLDVKALSNVTVGENLGIHFRPWSSPSLSRDFEEAKAHLMSEEEFIHALHEDVIAGYTVINDIWGQPALIARVDADRAISREGRATTGVLVFSFFTMAFIFSAVIFLLSEKWILSRLVRLSRTVKQFGRKGAVKGGVAVEGKDEIAQLGMTLNELLRSTHESHMKLHKAMEELKESERRYREIADFLPQVVFELDLEGRLTFSNRTAFQWFGYTQEEFDRGLDAFMMVHPEDHERLAVNMQRKLAGQEVHDSEYRGLAKDGRIFPVMIYSDIIRHEGEVAGLRGIIVDITSRKKREQEKEAMIELLHITNGAGSTHDLIQDVVPFLEASTLCEEVVIKLHCHGTCLPCRWGHGGGQGNGRRCLDSGHAPFLLQCDHDRREKRLFCPCGAPDVEHFDASFTEMSERGSVWWNRLKEMRRNSRILHETHSPEVSGPHEDFGSLAVITLRAGKKFIGTLHLRSREENHFSPARIAFMESMGDSIAVALAQSQAEEEHLRLSAAVEQAAEMIVIADTEGKIQYVNPAFEKVSGHSRMEVLKRNPRILKSGKQDHIFYRKLWTTIAGGAVWQGRLVNRKKNGSLYEVEATISPVRDERGRIINYVAVKRDVTHEAALQAQLRQAQKMEALGTLAGGIAHDFNNILTAVMGYAELTRHSPTELSRVISHTEQILKASERAKELVQQILAFSRPSEQKRKPLDPAPIVKEALKLLRASLPATVEVRLSLESQGHHVLADPTQVHQVLLNLCANAAHAMADSGGVLDVSLKHLELNDEGTDFPSGMAPGGYLQLMVRDSGCGMDHDTLQRIFDPYFTTKPKGVGTGMGLAVVHGIVTRHGGRIEVESEPGEGTAFHLFFPVCHSVKEQGETFDPGEEYKRGSETILLVDDEAALLDLSEQVLTPMGYRVQRAGNGEEALELFQKDPGRYDLVITDMTMPRMSGAELSRALLQKRPNLPIVLCTGYSELISREEARSMGIREYVEKPFAIRDLITAVQKALSHSGKSDPGALAV